MKNHSKRKQFTCPIPGCSASFTTSGNMKRHAKIHLPPEERTRYPCPHCDSRFTRNQKLEWHINRQHLENELPTFYCTKCKRGFLRKDYLKQHQATHLAVEDKEIFGCDQCQLKYNYRKNLLQHKKERHGSGSRTFPCTKTPCKSILSSERHLKRHLKSVHGPPKEKVFPCYHCLKKFSDITELKYHLNVHLNKTPFKCKDCGQGFHSPRGLWTHRMIHHLERKILKCPHCPKKYLSSSRFRNHVAVVHKKELKCGFCDVSFLCKESLEIHVRRVHTKEMPIKCGSCKYKTVAASSLRAHIKRIHNRERCYFCGNTFAFLSNHMSTHTMERIFRCKMCPRRSKSRKILNVHMYKIHGYKLAR